MPIGRNTVVGINGRGVSIQGWQDVIIGHGDVVTRMVAVPFADGFGDFVSSASRLFALYKQAGGVLCTKRIIHTCTKGPEQRRQCRPIQCQGLDPSVLPSVPRTSMTGQKPLVPDLEADVNAKKKATTSAKHFCC
ncbi:hypothetical protein GEV33_007131 [Tenebrio molitor]|uniref:Uncharacterized protein n=1 Tax=Tenebrio molitor TaxID=7067 RepID=A0A8J6LCN4_TENMO|nr:hypothetical protein GEV33_007131 [Tenebrio molitor]